MSLVINKNIAKGFSILLALCPSSLLFSPAISSILLIFLSIFSFFFFKKNNLLETTTIYRLLFFIYIVFFVLNIFSLLYTEDFLEGIGLIKKRVPMLIIPFVFYINIKIIDFTLLLKTYSLIILFVATFTVFNSLYSVYINDESLKTYFIYYVRYFYVNFMPYKMHPSYFGMLLCSAIVVVLNNDIFKVSFKVFAFFILAFNIYMISSQMMTFIFVMLCVFFLFKQLKFSFSKILYKYVIVATILLAVMLIFSRKHLAKRAVNVFNVESKSNILYRVSHFFEKGDLTRRKNWTSAFHVIENNMILGVGIGDGVNEMQKFRENNTWIYTSRLNAHNQYLEEFVHFGIIGFVCFVLFLLLIFCLSLGNLFYLSTFFLLFFSMITESILNRQVGVVVFSFLISVIVFNKLENVIKCF